MPAETKMKKATKMGGSVREMVGFPQRDFHEKVVFVKPDVAGLFGMAPKGNK